MNLFRVGALALGLWAAHGAATAAEPYVTYDDFNDSVLSPARWFDAERTRVVVGKTMRLAQRDWGLTNSNSGTQGISWGDTISRSGKVTQLRATVRVTALDVTTCAASGNAGFVRARVLGFFFNSGNRTAGSNVGDIGAQMYLIRTSNSADAPGVMRVEGNIFMCTSADCNQSVGLSANVPLGTVNVGAAATLQVDWDRAGKQFLFSLDKGAATAVGYTVDDSADAGNGLKTIGMRTNAASCMSGPRTVAFIDGKFDNVQVNATGKP